MFEINGKVMAKYNSYPQSGLFKKGQIATCISLSRGCKCYPVSIEVDIAVPYKTCECPKCGHIIKVSGYLISAADCWQPLHPDHELSDTTIEEVENLITQKETV